MNMIVAADRNWGIGRQGGPLIRIPNDRKHLLGEVEGKVVIMGRTAFASLYQGLPLPNCVNIVLSRDPSFRVKRADVVCSVEELLQEIGKYQDEDVYVIGGESVYRQLLPYCKVVHVTRLDWAYEADSYFPDLDKDEAWEITADSDEQTYFDIAYQFVRYERK
ncbi:MAG: dihydrofolate reductase [Candidatus Gastranaerophilales bacterium]|nr:dihydrofolate reductase [Candidatus Gastranaerophilales bacterium]